MEQTPGPRLALRDLGADFLARVEARAAEGDTYLQEFAERFVVQVRLAGDCWEWIGTRSRDGYGKTRYLGNYMPAHRASALALKGEGLVSGDIVRHTCDNPPCVNPAHLLVGTKRDNTADMLARMRHYRGEAHHRAKVTEDIVRDVRLRHVRWSQPGSGTSTKDLAEEFGISRGQISRIVNGRSWRHVETVGGAA